jgi:tetratricopeptide (TPR) repeat protein
MKKIVIIMLTVLLSSSFVFSQDLGKIARANFSGSRGEALYNKGRYQEAIEQLQNAIKIRPEHGRANYYLALT